MSRVKRRLETQDTKRAALGNRNFSQLHSRTNDDKRNFKGANNNIADKHNLRSQSKPAMIIEGGATVDEAHVKGSKAASPANVIESAADAQNSVNTTFVSNNSVKNRRNSNSKQTNNLN